MQCDIYLFFGNICIFEEIFFYEFESSNKMEFLSIYNELLSSISGGFAKAWSLLLEYIEKSALCKNSEVSLAALKSFQEMLQIRTESGSLKDEFQHLFENPHKTPSDVIIAPPTVERMTRSASDDPTRGQVSDNKDKQDHVTSENGAGGNALSDSSLWLTAWSVWLNIGSAVTTPPETKEDAKMYIPSQAFLTALVKIFPPLYEHIKAKWGVSDIKRLCGVLQQALAVPVHSDSSPFILPVGELALTGLQQAVMDCVKVLEQVCFI